MKNKIINLDADVNVLGSFTTSTNNFTSGYNNEISRNDRLTILGHDNSVINPNSSSIRLDTYVFGNENKITDGGNEIVVGHKNIIGNHQRVFIFGSNLKSDGSDQVLIGSANNNMIKLAGNTLYTTRLKTPRGEISQILTLESREIETNTLNASQQVKASIFNATGTLEQPSSIPYLQSKTITASKSITTDELTANSLNLQAGKISGVNKAYFDNIITSDKITIGSTTVITTDISSDNITAYRRLKADSLVITGNNESPRSSINHLDMIDASVANILDVASITAKYINIDENIDSSYVKSPNLTSTRTIQLISPSDTAKSEAFFKYAGRDGKTQIYFSETGGYYHGGEITGGVQRPYEPCLFKPHTKFYNGVSLSPVNDPLINSISLDSNTGKITCNELQIGDFTLSEAAVRECLGIGVETPWIEANVEFGVDTGAQWLLPDSAKEFYIQGIIQSGDTYVTFDSCVHKLPTNEADGLISYPIMYYYINHDNGSEKSGVTHYSCQNDGDTENAHWGIELPQEIKNILESDFNCGLHIYYR